MVIEELFTFSHNSLVKNDPLQLFHKMVDQLGVVKSEIRFIELEKFKKKCIIKNEKK